MTRGAPPLVAAALFALGACASGERPDESGLTPAEKSELVQRYYACARQADAGCMYETLHPDFQASDDPAGAMTSARHVDTMVASLRRSRVEARVLPHEGEEVWVVELWIDRHGSTSNRLRAFRFDDRLIRAKTGLAG